LSDLIKLTKKSSGKKYSPYHHEKIQMYHHKESYPYCKNDAPAPADSGFTARDRGTFPEVM
jgi:hypothetical protein